MDEGKGGWEIDNIDKDLDEKERKGKSIKERRFELKKDVEKN